MAADGKAGCPYCHESTGWNARGHALRYVGTCACKDSAFHFDQG